MKRAVGVWVAVSLLTGLFATSITLASPLQTATPITASSPKLNSNPATFAHINSAKSSETTVTTPAPAKETKQQDKKAISRCWNRLITVFREVRQAHKSKK